MKSWQNFIAEFLAVFVFVLGSAGAVLSNALSGGDIGAVGIALSTGLAILAMTYATSHISGAHINPAVTIAHWVTKKIDTAKGISYIIAQLLGGILGALVLKLFFSAAPSDLRLGTTLLGEGISPGVGFVIEAILTFVLVSVIYATMVDERGNRSFSGLAVGAVIILNTLIGYKLTGAAMNPARVFGPALVSQTWSFHWIYWVGPIVGAVVAAWVYEGVYLKRKA